MRKMVSLLQKRLCCNNAVTMATPQIFFSQPSILYPRHITESKKYGFTLGRGSLFFFTLLAAALNAGPMSHASRDYLDSPLCQRLRFARKKPTALEAPFTGEKYNVPALTLFVDVLTLTTMK